MNKRELIKALEPFPDDMPIIVRGYEQGVGDVIKIKEVKIKKNVNDHWFYGEHNLSEEGEAAILLDGKSHYGTPVESNVKPAEGVEIVEVEVIGKLNG